MLPHAQAWPAPSGALDQGVCTSSLEALHHCSAGGLEGRSPAKVLAFFAQKERPPLLGQKENTQYVRVCFSESVQNQ
jgi:hypothetical protein